MSADQTLLKKMLKEKKMSAYKLVRLSGMSASSVNAIVNGKYIPDSEKCSIIADVLEVPVQDIFPACHVKRSELEDITKNPDYDPRTLRDETILEGKEITMGEAQRNLLDIKVTQMVPGAANLVPELGRIKSRKVMDAENLEEFEGRQIMTQEQLCILTGIKAQGLDIDRIMVKTDKKLIMKNEFHLHPFIFVHNGEVMVIGYCHGKPLMIHRGLVLGELVSV